MWRCWSSTTCGSGWRRCPRPRPASGWTWPARSSRWTTRSRRTTSPGAPRSRSALDRLVEDFDLDSLAYYHRGLDGEQHERLGAGMILGASLLTARGIPATGEYELRTTVAQLATQVVGAGGSFCEIQALNFDDGVVEMGHDGPAHLAVSSPGPAAARARRLSRQARVGRERGVRRPAGPGHAARPGPGPRRLADVHRLRGHRRARARCWPSATPPAGSTSGRDPGEWVDEWSATGVGHHWSLSLDHRAADYQAAASLLGIEFRQV